MSGPSPDLPPAAPQAHLDPSRPSPAWDPDAWGGSALSAGLAPARLTPFHGTSLLIRSFLGRLEETFVRIYGTGEPECLQTIRTAGVMAMEIIANSDALYHNVEHSCMVTLVGQQILRGRLLRQGDVDARTWTHFIVSLLCHDIGYVRGICPGDEPGRAVVDAEGQLVDIPPGATDAFLTPYHVERGKLFARSRFENHPTIKADVIARNIENTRFPVPAEGDSTEGADYPGLVRAADLIGQLADPEYPRKLPALFYEFDETGANERMGYRTPEDLALKYPDFFWGMVSPHIQQALSWLQVTREGRQWAASLHSHVFVEEHRNRL